MDGKTLTGKLLSDHLVSGSLEAGEECRIRVDSTLVHDMSGLLAFMGFEAMGLDRVAVSAPNLFIDHNLVAMDASSLNDQEFLQSCARRFGLAISRPGNGICHSVYYHRLGRPGTILVGADSHSATAGALGVLGIGAGGLDVAVVMSGEPFQMKAPRVLNVRLEGKLRAGSCAKDVALLLLGRLGVKGCVGRIMEYSGPGVETLTVPQRATIANMGAEMGATSSIFPADEQVRRFLCAQGREEAYRLCLADPDADYEESLTIDLSRVEPMVALPGQPDRVVPVSQAKPVEFSQIFIGSCTNGSYTDLARAALVLRGRKVHSGTAVLAACGNRQIYQMLLRDGYIGMLVDAGVRFLECACGPCMGIGQAPASGAKILRTTNRNYPGRSGTPDAEMYLCGTEVAAASAITGQLSTPARWMDVSLLNKIKEPEHYLVDDGMLLRYDKAPTGEPLCDSPNIRPMPVKEPLSREISGPVSLKLSDGVSTDDIVPPEPKILTLRPNVPELSKYLFHNLDPAFAARAAAAGSSFLVAGDGYAQGSSREHAAIGCMYLGVQAVLVRSIHRIHRANLINYGVLPLLFEQQEDWAAIDQGDQLFIEPVWDQLEGDGRIRVENRSKDCSFYVRSDLTPYERELIRAGGLIPYIRSRRGKREAVER